MPVVRESGASARPVDARLADEALAYRLADGLARLQIDLAEDRQRRLLDFVALLVKWSSVYNLTSVRSPNDMLAVHLLDSVSILPLVDELSPAAILDVGSGAGLPSIPIAIARPALTVNSVDAVAKKIGFQLQAKSSLGLANLRPVHCRVETLNLPSQPSLIVSRAYASLSQMVESIEALVTPTTRVIAMKGSYPAAELSALPKPWRVEEVRTLDVPYLGAERCAVVLERSCIGD